MVYLQNVGITIVSFVILASLWIYHHEFIKIDKLNFPYLWINMLFLAAISFIPFSTSLIGNYAKFFISEIIFGLNILLSLLSFVGMYYYAYHNNFLVSNNSPEEKRYILNTFIMLMGLTVMVNLLDYNVSPNFIYLFLLIPVISTLRDIWFNMKHE